MKVKVLNLKGEELKLIERVGDPPSASSLVSWDPETGDHRYFVCMGTSNQCRLYVEVEPEEIWLMEDFR